MGTEAELDEVQVVVVLLEVRCTLTQAKSTRENRMLGLLPSKQM